MTTPKELEQFALDRGLSYRQLAEAITKVVGRPMNWSSVYRFCAQVGGPSRLTRHAIETFMAAQRGTSKKVRHGVSR